MPSYGMEQEWNSLKQNFLEDRSQALETRHSELRSSGLPPAPPYPRTITKFRCSSLVQRASGPTKTVDSRSFTMAGPLTVAPA